MQIRYLGVLLLLGVIWGASFLFIKVGVAEIPPATLVALRLIIAAVMLLVVLAARRLQLPRTLRAWGDLLFVGAFGVVLPFMLITWSETLIPSGMAAILNATTPLFTALLSYGWASEERLHGSRLLGVGLGFVGVLIAVGIANLRLDDGETLGKLAVLLAAICYAVAGLYGRRAFRGMPPLVPASGQILCGALLITPLALLNDGLPTTWPSPIALGAVLVLAVVGTAVAYILFYWLLERTGATRTSMVTYLTPPLALVYGALLLNEPVTLGALLGLALVFAGVILASRQPRPRQAAAA